MYVLCCIYFEYFLCCFEAFLFKSNGKFTNKGFLLFILLLQNDTFCSSKREYRWFWRDKKKMKAFGNFWGAGRKHKIYIVFFLEWMVSLYSSQVMFVVIRWLKTTMKNIGNFFFMLKLVLFGTFFYQGFLFIRLEQYLFIFLIYRTKKVYL